MAESTPLDLGTGPAAWVVIRAQAGDRSALDQLLRAIQTPLLTHLSILLHDDDDALDVLQDSLLIIARKLRWLRDPRWFRAWAYRIATREAVRQARKSRRRIDILPAELEQIPSVERDDDRAFDADLVARVPDLIAGLPPMGQIVIRMHYLEGMTLPEIAEALSAPMGTIKSRLAYGLASLRRALAEKQD